MKRPLAAAALILGVILAVVGNRGGEGNESALSADPVWGSGLLQEEERERSVVIENSLQDDQMIERSYRLLQAPIN